MAKRKKKRSARHAKRKTLPRIRYVIRDSVFSAMFKRPKYLLRLYRDLHPEDTTATEADLTNITLQSVLAVRQYNDLAFIARGKLLILVEAQSTWTENVLIRLMIYLLHQYYEYIMDNDLNLFSTKKLTLPKPELYVIYTGERGDLPDELILSRDFFDGEEIALDVRAKVIYDWEEDSIIKQYVEFSKVAAAQVAAHGRTDKALLEIIRICKDRNILKEFLEEHEKEAYTAMQLFSREFIERAMNKEIREDAMKETAVDVAKELLRNGASLDLIERSIKLLTRDELEALQAEVQDEVLQPV